MASSAAAAAGGAAGAAGGSSQNPWTNGPGYYIYINSKYADITLAKITPGLSQLQAEGPAIRGILRTQGQYKFAGSKVRARLPEYPCGNIIGPSFFAPDKLDNTINIIILFVVNTPTGAATRAGGAALVAQGFAVLRDLNLADAMAAASSTYGGDSLAKQRGNYLYIEGVCASAISRQHGGSGTRLMQLVHKLAYYSTFAGTKLASLAYVIPYYFNKFAYRFRDGCESGAAAAAANPKLKFHDLNVLARNLSNIDEDDVKYNRQWLAAIKAITQNGFNAEVSTEQHKTLASLRERVGIWWETEEGSRYLDAWERIGMQDQGFYMYFCFYNNPTYGVHSIKNTQTEFTKSLINQYRDSVGLPPLRDAAAGAAAASKATATGKGGKHGGGRKRRRKTKKRALKKRHRRRKTRRRRRKHRRKHRRRRTRRHHRRKTRRR